MTYLITEQTGTQPLQSKADLCKLIIVSFFIKMKKDMVPVGIVVVMNLFLNDLLFYNIQSPPPHRSI